MRRARRPAHELRRCGRRQIERLLAHERPERRCSVLFAGGIHDARSAAMVAALAAPLAARGAKIGVLMGTAYLFTEEAVAAGAIQPGFQRGAIACETHGAARDRARPRHALRRHRVRARVRRREAPPRERAGTPPQEMWAQLEQLNLGRLRIAAKGLRARRRRARRASTTPRSGARACT